MNVTHAGGTGPKPIGSDEEGFAAVLARLTAGVPQGSRVLDCPAGRGALTHRLVAAGYEVSACDIVPDLFEIEGMPCEPGDLNQSLPYENDSFDAITSCNGVHRVFAVGRCVSEYARVLRPGGSLFVTFPNYTKISRRVRFLFRGLNSTNQARIGAVIDEPEAHFRQDLGLPQLLFAARASKLRVEYVGGARTRWTRLLTYLPLIALVLVGGRLVSRKTREKYFWRETHSRPALISDFLVLELRKNGEPA